MKPKVKIEDLERMINEAETESAVFWGKETVVSYRLKNGFTVLGRSACVCPENFNAELGMKFARENAIDKMWELEGYLLQNKLYDESLK